MGARWNLARNILRSNRTRLDRPYKLTWAVTYRCNSRCRTCNIWNRPAPDELSLDEARRLFQTNPNLAWIDFTGGEVTLRSDFVEIVKAALTHCPALYMVHFPTNGLLPDRAVETVRQVLDAKPHKLIVSVSIDGPPDVHDHLRGGEGFFQKSTETIRRLRAMENGRFQVFPGMTLSAENVGHLDATAAALVEAVPGFRPEDLHVNIAQTSGHYYGNEEMDTSFQATALAEIQAYTARKGRKLDGIHALERAYLKLAESFVKTGKTPLACAALSASCFLDPTGTIYPCCVDGEPVGRLDDFEFDLRAAWASEAATRIRHRIVQGQCSHCWTPCEAYQSLFARLGTVLRCNLT